MIHSFKYGSFEFEWEYQDVDLKNPTITVEKGAKALLRGRGLSLIDQKQFIRKKARWIREKTIQVNAINESDIVSGSRLKYLGRRFLIVIEKSEDYKGAIVEFQNRRFKIKIDAKIDDDQQILNRSVEKFYRSKFDEKILPRVREWEEKTSIKTKDVKIHKFPSRWGSCTHDHVLEFHPRILELAPKVIDYVIVHELCHTLERTHNKQFWKHVESFYPNWKECHDRLQWDV